MRKFKFIGDQYGVLEEGNTDYAGYVIGEVYDYDSFAPDCDFNLLTSHYVKEYPKDWQEVFEEEKVQVTTLHKDTDLGYFAGLAMQAMISRSDQNSGWSEGETSQCIYIAKELINQLNKETK